MREITPFEIAYVAGGQKKPVSKPSPKPKPEPSPSECEPPWYERFTGLPPQERRDIVIPDPWLPSPGE
jgi:hypothetical protein